MVVGLLRSDFDNLRKLEPFKIHVQRCHIKN